jgi:hypothetical protein
MRLVDSLGLFGAEDALETAYEIECSICGTLYNPALKASRIYPVYYSEFCGKIVCECCFEDIENEILRRKEDILAWLDRKEFREKNKGRLVEATMNKIYEQENGRPLSDRVLRF